MTLPGQFSILAREASVGAQNSWYSGLGQVLVVVMRGVQIWMPGGLSVQCEGSNWGWGTRVRMLRRERLLFLGERMSWSFLCVCAKLLQSCLALCNPMDQSPPGSSAHVTLQARILEWGAIPFSRGSSRPRNQTSVSYVSCVGR